MIDPSKRKYIRWGVTGFIVIAASILLALGLSRLSVFRAWVGGILQVFSPIIWGIVIAYILNPVAAMVEKFFAKLLGKKLKERTAKRIGHALGVIAAMLLALAVIAAVIMLIAPQVLNSIKTLVANGKSYYATLETWVNSLLENHPELKEPAETALNKAFHFLEDWIQNSLLSSVSSVMTAVTTGVYSVLKWLLNFLIGMIIAAYLLAGKERYIAQIRKINAALWNQKIASRVVEIAQHSNRVFGGFIRGKIVDSAIIGVLCYIGAAIMQLPYSILVATIVGITNVIPFFGPIIGAVPCALIILLVSPIQCLYFLIFVFVLQQIDGNIIGPRILGDTTGLSSFWVLVSITLFSGLFGFAGMILGVPVFAVIYILVKELTEERLARKGLPVETSHYYTNPQAAVAEEPSAASQPEQAQDQPEPQDTVQPPEKK